MLISSQLNYCIIILLLQHYYYIILTLMQVHQKNTEIKRLKSNIKALINLADDANRRVKANAHNQETSDKKNHETKVAKITEDIAALKKRLGDVVAENKEKEQSLRKVRIAQLCVCLVTCKLKGCRIATCSIGVDLRHQFLYTLKVLKGYFLQATPPIILEKLSWCLLRAAYNHVITLM